jgi:hypothetical protein
VTVLHVAPPPQQRIWLVEEQHRAAGLGGADERRRFLSVSPTYLLMVAARSMQERSSWASYAARRWT